MKFSFPHRKVVPFWRENTHTKRLWRRNDDQTFQYWPFSSKNKRFTRAELLIFNWRNCSHLSFSSCKSYYFRSLDATDYRQTQQNFFYFMCTLTMHSKACPVKESECQVIKTWRCWKHNIICIICLQTSSIFFPSASLFLSVVNYFHWCTRTMMYMYVW